MQFVKKQPKNGQKANIYLGKGTFSFDDFARSCLENGL